MPRHHDADDDPETPAARARERWGIERVRNVHEPMVGGEVDLARALQRNLRHLPVVMLHDRLLPGGLLTEFIGVGPGGVTVIVPAGVLPGPLQVERLHGMFSAYVELLRDGTAADRTAALHQVRLRVTTVSGLIGDRADVQGALCLGTDDGPEALTPLRVDDLLVGAPRSVAALCARQGRLTDLEVAAVIDILHATCPAAPPPPR